jgi:hypothetical protein
MSEEQPSLIPPEEELTIPAGTLIEEQSWVVVARNPRVNKEWEKLIKQFPENTRRCYMSGFVKILCSVHHVVFSRSKANNIVVHGSMN